MVLPRRDCAFSEALMTMRKDALTLCGITKKCTCAYVTEIFVTEQSERLSLVVF